MASDPENILIVKLSAIGDVIHTLPALNALRQHFPRARITWLVEAAAASLLEGHPALDRVLVSQRKHWLEGLSGPGRRRHLKAIVAFIKKLRDTRYDLIFDFQAALKGGILIALARGRRKIGFGRGLEHQEYSYLFLNETVPAVDMEIHALTRGLMLLEQVGIPAGEITYNLSISPQERERVSRMLVEGGLRRRVPMVAINPVAQWETKLWDNGRFAALADRLIEQHDVTVVFTGGLPDKEIVGDIVNRMHCRALDLTGRTTLKALAAVYEQAALLVSTDTGPMHLGAAVGVPVVALFGPTAPWRTGPFGPGHRVVRANPGCAPCFKRRCPTRDCMAGITVDRVMAEIEQLGILKQLPE